MDEQEQRSRPTAGQVEERSAAGVELEGRRIRGIVPYGIESRDMGGWRELIEPSAFRNTRLEELRATIDHGGVPLGRYPKTLELEDSADGLRWALSPPRSRQDVLEAVERGDMRAGSWRMVVGRDEWRGEVRHVHEIKELLDVCLVGSSEPAYPSAAVEVRTHDTEGAGVVEQDNDTQEQRAEERSAPADGLPVEARAESSESEQRSFGEIVVESIRDVRVGETRSLASANSALSPPELSSRLFDTLKASSIALSSGIPVVATDRESISFPQLTANVSPAFYSEGSTITPGDPTFISLETTPQKIAHIIETSNEAIDDSEPPLVRVLTDHLSSMLALKLDSAVYVGGTAVPGITGLNHITGAQVGGTLTTAGTATATSYSQLLAGVGLLRGANVPEPYVLACHPNVRTAFERLTDSTGQPLQAPPSTPPMYSSTQITAGTAYLYAPSSLALVRRQDASIELDRSRLFNKDQSELRGKLRANLLAPYPNACVRLTAG